MKQLRDVFVHLKDAGLKVKPAKCHLLHNCVCYLGNRLSGYSGYSDIRKNLSVRIAVSEKLISKFYLFEVTGLCFSIRKYLGIRHQHRQFAHYSNTFFIPISGYDFQLSISYMSLLFLLFIHTYNVGATSAAINNLRGIE